MWLVVALSMLGVAQPARPPQPPGAGTAVVKGKVIDKQTRAPLSRAVVTLRSTQSRTAMQNSTDQEGRFEFAGVAAGPYDLHASAGPYRSTHVAAGYLVGPNQIGPLLQLKDGEERSNIVIELPRARAISGRVTDEEGNPLAGVEVILPGPQGARMGPGGRPRTTDDRGIFRLHGLASGRYVVCATAQGGPSFDSQAQRRPQFVQTCYPSATDVTDATDVTLADQDVGGLEIRMQRRPTYVLSGQVIGTDGGPPENASLLLTRFERNGSSGTGTRLQTGGAFMISNVTPGTYEVSAQLGRAQYSSQPDEREPQWGAVRFELTSADVEGLVIQLRAAATLKGTVSFEDPPEKPGSTPMELVARPLNSAGGSRSNVAPAKVAENGNFELRGLFGSLVLQMSGGMPPGYSVKSIRYRGRDIVDTAVEFDGDPAQPVEVLLTNRTAELSGQVVDDNGAPLAGVRIIHFPVDASRWKAFQGARSTTSAKGLYRIPQLVAGEYFVVAVSAADQRLLNLPDDFDRLAAIAERITVLERERRTADLRVNTVPPRKKQP